MKNIESNLEGLLFRSRWLLAPFYGGLVFAIFLLLLKFGHEFILFIPTIFEARLKDFIIQILVLIDLTLVANLLLIFVFSGYETFVSKIDNLSHEDRPSWMGTVDFSELKIKLFGSIIAISGIELLKAFMTLDKHTTEELAWSVGIHLTFIISGFLFAFMDKISAEAKKLECEAHELEEKTNYSRKNSEHTPHP